MARNQVRVDLGYYGEMGLRSHLFLNEFDSSARGFNSLSRSRRDPYASEVLDTLSDQFSSLSLLRPKLRPTAPSPSSLKPLRPRRLSSVNNISDCAPKANKRLYGERPKLSLGITDAFYELHPSRLRKNELQPRRDRAMILQRQESRLHKGGLVHRNCNVLKESVGTGVFHPLQRPADKTLSSMKTRNAWWKADQKNRNQSEKEELMAKGRRGVMMAAKKQQQQDECHYHLPADMDFSKDWTF